MNPISPGLRLESFFAVKTFLISACLLSSTAFAQLGPMDSVSVSTTTNQQVNPILSACLLPDGSCPLPPSGQKGHPLRLFIPGQTPTESTGYYDRNMVWLSKSGGPVPPAAKFRIEAFFAPLCPTAPNSNSCVADSFKFYYQASAVNQPPGERRISEKNNFDAPKILTKTEILKHKPNPLAQIMLTGGNHSFADCLAAGTGVQSAAACVIGFTAGGAVCLNTGNIPAMQSYTGTSYCAIQSGCPAGWVDAGGDKNANNPCGSGPCCH
ncbi:MAG: hypothetical protein KGP28_12745 [Bdellovibrionales bacterium]|nr:hypothetical protein [Bdellovibrionales bacterium]